MTVITTRQGVEREFHFTDADFQTIRTLIHQRAGIQLSPSKQDMVYSRLSRRLRSLGLRRFEEYLALLQPGSAEWESFVNALTTNLTAFFREPHHFPLLAAHIQARRTRNDLTLWCAAASTGEEPYSMAMTMVELFNSWTPPVRIIATDIDTKVLKTAEAGVYPLEKTSQVSPERLKRFFKRGVGAQSGSMKVNDALRALVKFSPLNLLADDWRHAQAFDCIFCRNVMIYFDKKTQYEIIKRFVPFMQPDALLFAGHSESLQHANDLVTLRGRTVYEVAQAARAKAGSGIVGRPR